MRRDILIILSLLFSEVVVANPCNDLSASLAGSEKITPELTSLQTRCEDYRNQKTRRLNKLNELLSEEDSLSAQNETAVCYKQFVESFQRKLISLGIDIKEKKIAAFSDVNQALAPLLAQKATLAEAIETLREGQPSHCETKNPHDVWTVLEELEQSYPDDQQISEIGLNLRNKAKLKAIALSDLRKTHFDRLVKSMAKIDELIASKRAVIRAAEGRSVRKGIANAVEPLNASINAQIIYLDFINKSKIKTRLKRAQDYQFIGALDIAQDEAEDLIELIKKFQVSIASKLPQIVQNNILNDLNFAEGIKKRSQAQSFQDKDTRTLSYLRYLQAEITKNAATCAQKHPTFSIRYQKFRQRFEEIEKAYSPISEGKLAEARHRIAEQVLIDSHFLYVLCKEEVQ